MSFTVRDTQARCAALGFDPGPIDGLMGPKTRRAVKQAMEARGARNLRGIFGRQGIHCIVWHWSGGAYGVNDVEEDSYNGLVDHQGNRIDGEWRPEAQANYQYPHHGASHTWRANTGRAGMCADAMAGARERPLHWGKYPLTQPQIDEMCLWSAEWCLEFDVPVSKWSTLGHAEVQPTLGIRQRNKWDFMVLPGMTSVDDPVKVGDTLRGLTAERLQDLRLAA